jgi:hypothetical protein
MTRCGYFLESKEHRPAEAVRQAKMAEQAGFDRALDLRPLASVAKLPTDRRTGRD